MFFLLLIKEGNKREGCRLGENDVRRKAQIIPMSQCFVLLPADRFHSAPEDTALSSNLCMLLPSSTSHILPHLLPHSLILWISYKSSL